MFEISLGSHKLFLFLITNGRPVTHEVMFRSIFLLKNSAEEDLERIEISQHGVHRLYFRTDFEFYLT